MTHLFERLRLQAHFRKLFDEMGQEQGWQLIQAAVARESERHQTELPESDQEIAE